MDKSYKKNQKLKSLTSLSKIMIVSLSLLVVSSLKLNAQGTGSPSVLPSGTVFHETFGNGTERFKSPYTPTGANSFLFADPNTVDNPLTTQGNYSGNEATLAKEIENGNDNGPGDYYAVVAPAHIYRSVSADYTSSWPVWSIAGSKVGNVWPGDGSGGAKLDATNTIANTTDYTGAAMVINAGKTLNRFYRRSVTLAVNKTYELSYYLYIENTPVEVGSAIFKKDGASTLISFSTSGANITKGSWQKVSHKFTVPSSLVTEFDVALSNHKAETSGNDFLIDEIVLKEVEFDPNAPVIDVGIKEPVATPNQKTGSLDGSNNP